MMQSSNNSSDDDEDNNSSRSRKDEAQVSSSKKNASKSKKPAASSRNLSGTSSQSRAADTGNDRFLSASERKRNREKERRNKLNHGLDELATLLFSIDPSLQTYGDAPSSPGSSWATNTPLPKEGAHTITNRVELINCTLKVLKQLHHENEERKQILNDLAKGGMVTIPHVDSAFVRSKKNPNIPPPSSSHESMQLLNQKRQMALLGRRSDGDLSQQPPLPPGFEGTAAPTRPSEDTRSPPLDSRMSPGQLIGGNETAADPHMRHLGGSRSASGVLPPRPHAEVFSARAADVVGATDALLARNPHALSSSSAAAAALLFDQQRLLMGLGVPPPAPPPAALFGNPLAGHQFAGQLDHAGLWAAAAAAATAPHHAAAAMVLPPAAASVVAAAAATRDPLVHPLHAYAQTRPVPGEAPSSAARALEGKTTSAFRQSPPPPPPPLHSSVMREGSDASAAAAAATREPRAAQQQTDVGEEDLLPEKAPSGAQTQGGGATDDIERKRHGVTSEEEEEREISMPDRKKARISTKPNS